MALLIDLLTEREIEDIKYLKKNNVGLEVSTEFNKITIQQLSDIAFVLMKTKYKNYVPNCVITAEAINILTERAQERNINLF